MQRTTATATPKPTEPKRSLLQINLLVANHESRIIEEIYKFLNGEKEMKIVHLQMQQYRTYSLRRIKKCSAVAGPGARSGGSRERVCKPGRLAAAVSMGCGIKGKGKKGE